VNHRIQVLAASDPLLAEAMQTIALALVAQPNAIDVTPERLLEPPAQTIDILDERLVAPEPETSEKEF